MTLTVLNTDGWKTHLPVIAIVRPSFKKLKFKSVAPDLKAEVVSLPSRPGFPLDRRASLCSQAVDASAPSGQHLSPSHPLSFLLCFSPEEEGI